MKNLYPSVRLCRAISTFLRSRSPWAFGSLSFPLAMLLTFAISACSSDRKQAADIATPPEGQQLYEYQCARCHGPDGKADTYPMIKRLDGIGARYTLDEIIELTRRSGNVDLSPLDADELRSLAEYVASL